MDEPLPSYTLTTTIKAATEDGGTPRDVLIRLDIDVQKIVAILGPKAARNQRGKSQALGNIITVKTVETT